MTVLEATERLFEWFSENDYFVLDEDLIRVNPISDTVERDKAVFLLALEDLESNELLAKGDAQNKKNIETVWVLKKPFTAFEQNVAISPSVAMALSQIINNACEEFGDDTDYCSAANLQEKDIRNLILLYNHRQNAREENI